MPDETMIKLKYIGKDTIRLVSGLGNPLVINRGDVVEFPEARAHGFLRSKKVEYKKGKRNEIPLWEIVKQKKEGKE